MALIKCPECGKDVSDTVECCIHCGFVLKKSVEKPEKSQPEAKEPDDATILPKDDLEKGQGSSVFKFLIATAGVLAVFFVFAMIMSNIAGDSESAGVTVEQTTVPAAVMNPMTIFGDYYDNQITADEKHIGQRYRINSVRVSSITEKYVYIDQPFDGGKYAIKLIYSPGQLDYLRNIKAGDYVSFEGVLTNIFMTDAIFCPELTFEKVIFVNETE